MGACPLVAHPKQAQWQVAEQTLPPAHMTTNLSQVRGGTQPKTYLACLLSQQAYTLVLPILLQEVAA